MGRKAINTRDLTLVKDVDWARLAAFIDGEGNIRIHKCSYRYDHPRVRVVRTPAFQVVLCITNTDPRLAKWLTDRFGGSSSVRPAQKATWKPCVQWVIACDQACKLLRRCREYLVMKGEQADIALALQETLVHQGRRGVPEIVQTRREELKSQLDALTARGQSAAAIN